MKKKKSSGGTFELLYLNQTLYSFSQIGGCEEIKRELFQMKDMVGEKADEYKKWNVRLPRGVLLYGEPGTGKTLLAKCFTGESGLPIISTSGAEFQEKYVGTGAARIRELFEFARQEAPCIVYIDEIDAVARKRGGDGESAQAERDATLNQLLVEMDGFGGISEDRVMVMASTNRLDVLDEALLRPGRFDKKLNIPLPNTKARSKIIDIHLTGKPIAVEKEWLVNDLTAGMSGAEIEHLLNEASLYGIRHSILPVNSTILDSVREVLALGLTAEHIRTTLPVFTVELGKRIAVHEMGHVLVALLSPSHPKPKKVTMYSPSSQMLGYTVFGLPSLPSLNGSISDKNNENDTIPLPTNSVMSTKNALLDKIQVLLGGRVAEELVLGTSTISSGASDDFQKAHHIAFQMIINFGMGTQSVYPTMSDKGRQKAEEATMEILNRCMENVRGVLQSNRFLLEHMSNELISKGTMTLPDLVVSIQQFSTRPEK
jgi:cell division protease FtsH